MGSRQKKQKKPVQRAPVPADPRAWSPQSQRSISFEFVRQYHDCAYTCSTCRKSAVFTAEDQKYTYEVRKAPIDQRRVLCAECWRQSLLTAADLESCRSRWATDKAGLARDKEFLSRWLELLHQRDHFVRCKPDTATRNMLRKLLDQLE